MSYCRFSSDNHRSEVYVYASAQGIIIRVAKARPATPAPEPDVLELMFSDADAATLVAAQAAFDDWMATVERIPITLPHAGATLIAMTAAHAVAQLTALRELGYHVPQFALDELRRQATNG